MTPADTNHAGRWASWADSWRATIVLIATVTLARLLYLAWWCPYTLIEDEAHYWEWARRPALSYYSKGPGVAWTIGAGTWAAGSTEFGVRLGAAVSAAVLALGAALLAYGVMRDRRAAFFAAACAMLAPVFQLLGLMMTIDGPYLACWALAAWGAWRALGQGRGRGWLVLGAALGAGVLTKYTILLLLPGVLAWWLLVGRESARARGQRVSAGGVVAGLALLGLGLLPIVLWNQENGWPTVRHLLGHLGVEGGDMPVTQGRGGWHYSPKWTLDLLATQLGMVGPILALGIMEGVRAWRRRRQDPGAWAGESFLILTSVPVLLFYFGVSFVTEPEGNWPIAGYVTLLPLAARRVVSGMEEWSARLGAWRALPAPRPRAGFFVRRPESPTQVLWYASVALGVGVALAVPRLDWVARLPGVGKVVPLHRFMGADRMAAHVARLEDGLRAATGKEPFVVAAHYGRASQLAFYLPGRPTVYCSSSLMLEGRRTQYDYWAQTDLRRADGLLGRPAVAIGRTREEWAAVFERVELVGTLEGDGKKGRPAYLGWNFRGFPPGGLAAASAQP